MTFTKVQSGFVDLTTSSGLTVGAGTASTPALNFSDNSTGFFRSGSNEIAISLSGSQKFTFKNNNFGIGTNSPDVPLTVVGNTKISGNTHIGGASGSGARLSVYRQTQYAANPVFEAYSNHIGNTQTKIFEVDGDGSVLIDGGIGVDTAGTLEVRQRGETRSDGIAISSSHATAHRIWKNSSGRLNIGVNLDSDQIFITQAAAPNGYIGLNKPTRFGAGDGGPADYGAMGSGTVSTDVTQQPWYTNGGRHYIHFDVNGGNNESHTQDPAYIAWKGSTSSSPNTVIPNGGYMARIGGYRDLVNNGSTSLCWESVHNMSANPHLPTRNLTLRYDGRIGFGSEIEPACVVDMSQDTTAICLPRGTVAQRSGFTNEEGQIRYNTESNSIELYDGNNWSALDINNKIISTSGDHIVESTINGLNKKTHFFNTSGTFVNTGATALAEIWVIGAGGGGGGGGYNSGSGGGGGGGMVFASVNIPAGSYTVTVGTPGSGGAAPGNGSDGGFSQIVIGNDTFKATGGSGGNGGPASSGGTVGAGGSGGTGTINNGTSYSPPAGGASAVYGTGGTGGTGGQDAANGTGPTNGTNGGAGAGSGGANMGNSSNLDGSNGSSTYFTGGGGGGGFDGDGSTQGPNNRGGTGGTGYFSGGNGGDFDTDGTNGASPSGSAGTNYSGSAKGTTGTSRKNNGGGGGAYGGGGGSAADSANSTNASGGQGGGGVVIIRYNV